MGTYILETTAYLIYSLPALLLCLPYGLPPAIRPHIALFSVPIYSLACAAGGLFPRLRRAALHLGLLCLFLFSLSMVESLNEVRFGIQAEDVVAIECTAVSDSSLSRRGNGLVTVRLTGCTSQSGTDADAWGVATLTFSGDALITCGERISATGSYSDGFFGASSIQVTSKGPICRLRERLILAVEKRVADNLSEAEDAQILSLMLILGRAEDENLYVRKLASECGCIHVLALSGMHLGLLTRLFSPLSRKRRLKWLHRTLSSSAVLAFVFLAGPRPSLIRAAVMFLLSDIEPKQRLAVSYILQSAFFPSTVDSLGSVYSYCATSAIINSSGKPATTLRVLLLTIPIQLASDGCWCPAVIIAQIPAAFLAALSMANGFLILAFGRLTPLLNFNNLVCTAMERLFELCAQIPQAGLTGYIILAAAVLLLDIVVTICRKRTMEHL